MRFDLITIFPDPLEGWLRFSIVERARERGVVDIRVVNLRDFTSDRYRTVDDRPYGGGAGMLMKPGPIARAIEASIADRAPNDRSRVLLLAPWGRRLDQALLEELSRERQVIIVAGRYEGVDERVRSLVTDEVSLGDFILTGGELAAAVIVDGVVRLLPGVLGKDSSAEDESFTSGVLEYPQYTRPPVFRGLAVPDRLLGGHHAEVQKWRERQGLLRTAALRPDLLPSDWRDRVHPPQKTKKAKRRPAAPGD